MPPWFRQARNPALNWSGDTKTNSIILLGTTTTMSEHGARRGAYLFSYHFDNDRSWSWIMSMNDDHEWWLGTMIMHDYQVSPPRWHYIAKQSCSKNASASSENTYWYDVQGNFLRILKRLPWFQACAHELPWLPWLSRQSAPRRGYTYICLNARLSFMTINFFRENINNGMTL